MTPTETLRHEHEVILLVVGAAQREGRYIQETGRVHAQQVEKMVDFMRNFADRCHHAKEEKLLFPRMQERATNAEAESLAVMLHEHEQARAAVRAMAEAIPKARKGEAAAIALIGHNLLAYAALLREHISKEDTILYPVAEDILTSEDQADLAEHFERVESEEMGRGVHEKYHELAHELAKT